MYVKDIDGVEYVCQTSPSQKYELNSNVVLSTTILPSKTNKLFIEDIAEMWSIYDFDGVEHTILYVKRRGKGELQTVELQAIPKFFDVLDNTRIYEEYNEHMTAKVAFDRIFGDIPFNYVMLDTFLAVDWEGFGAGESRLETFRRAIERYKCEFRIVGNTVYLESKIGRDTQFMYRHGLNASNVVVESDAMEMWTVARGYGDYEDGEDDEGGGWQNAKLERTYISPLANIPSIGHRHAPPIKNGNITLRATMDEQLKTLVDESLKVSVTTDLHDLRKQGYPLAQPELGDRVFLIDDRIGFNEEVRVVSISITKDWKGEVVSLELTFGELGISQRYKSGLSTATKAVLDLFEGRRKLPFYAYDDAVQQASKDLNNARTELLFPDEGGIWAVEKTDPNYLTRFTSKGLGVSDDGGATFKTAVTGRGVVGEMIVGKILIGESLYIENEASTFSVIGEEVTIDGASLNITGGLPDSQIGSADQWNTNGTYINGSGIYTGSLNALQIQLGFNDIGGNVKIIPSGLETYEGPNKTSRLSGRGHEFYRGSKRVGKIGASRWSGNPDYHGLSFQLDSDADYFTFGFESDDQSEYLAKLVWHSNTKQTNIPGFSMYDDLRVYGEGYYSRDLVVQGTLRANYTVQAGTRAKMMSTSNGARLYASDNVWLYVNESGQVGVSINGAAYAIYNP